MSNEQKVQEQIKRNKADLGGSAESGSNVPFLNLHLTPSALSHSEQIDQIIPALAQAKRQFAVAIKDSNNPFYHSKYADLASIERAIAPSLIENGLFLMQPANPHEHVNASVYVTIETILWHESGQFLSSRADVPYMTTRGQQQRHGEPGQIDVHGMGSMLTYFRRYLKLAFLDIITDDDDGNRAMPQQPPAQRQPVQYQPQPENLSSNHADTQEIDEAVEAKPSAEEIHQLKQDILKLDEETQQTFSEWLERLGLSISELENERFQKVRLRVDQKLRDTEIDAAERVVKLVKLQKQSKIPMSFIGKYVNRDNLKQFADLSGEVVQDLLEDWDSVKEAWKEHRPITAKQLKQLLQICKDHNLPEWGLLRYIAQHVKLDDLKELPASLFRQIIDNITQIAEEMASDIAEN